MDSSGRLLVVGDDPPTRRFLAVALVEANYQVRSAADGRDALSVMAQWRPDVLLVDANLPLLREWGLAQELERVPSYRSIPVVLLSDAPDSATAAQMLRAAALVPKPIDLAVLLSVLDRLRRDGRERNADPLPQSEPRID